MSDEAIVSSPVLRWVDCVLDRMDGGPDWASVEYYAGAVWSASCNCTHRSDCACRCLSLYLGPRGQGARLMLIRFPLTLPPVKRRKLSLWTRALFATLFFFAVVLFLIFMVALEQ